MLCKHRAGCTAPSMFRFRKTPKDPLSDVRAVDRWLAGFPANDPLAPIRRMSQTEKIAFFS